MIFGVKVIKTFKCLFCYALTKITRTFICGIAFRITLGIITPFTDTYSCLTFSYMLLIITSTSLHLQLQNLQNQFFLFPWWNKRKHRDKKYRRRNETVTILQRSCFLVTVDRRRYILTFTWCYSQPHILENEISNCSMMQKKIKTNFYHVSIYQIFIVTIWH